MVPPMLVGGARAGGEVGFVSAVVAEDRRGLGRDVGGPAGVEPGTPATPRAKSRAQMEGGPPPMTPGTAGKPALRWGIAGTGHIAGDFVRAMLLNVPGCVVTAVAASRNLDKAREFAARFENHNRGVAIAAYDSYEDLCRAPDVDVVYVATVHTLHFVIAADALANNKHALVEKPIAMNYRQTKALFKLAKARKRLLVEALWTRFFPAVKRARNLLQQEQLLGPTSTAMAAFGFATEDGSVERLYNPALGGGATLDIGMYPIALATTALRPEEYAYAKPQMSATGVKSPSTGVDTSAHVSLAIAHDRLPPLAYSGGADATTAKSTVAQRRTLHCTCSYAIRERMPETATFCGTKGHLTVDEPAHAPTRLAYVLHTDELRRIEIFNFPNEGPTGDELPKYHFTNSQGLMYEAAAIRDAISKGRLECAEWTTAESLWMARTLESVRASMGVRYEDDRAPLPWPSSCRRKTGLVRLIAKACIAGAGALAGMRLHRARTNGHGVAETRPRKLSSGEKAARKSESLIRRIATTQERGK